MTASANGTTVLGPNGGSITDGKGNVWTISPSGMVVENGVTDPYTANVTELAFKNGLLWQENTSYLWYAELGRAPGSYHGWSPATSVAPVPVTRQWIGGGNNSAGNPHDWNTASLPQPGDTLNVGVEDFSGQRGPHYTLNVTGNQLTGDQLNFLPYNAFDTINVAGITALSFETNYGTDITVNLAKHSEWIGGFGGHPDATVNINGTGVWDNNTTTGTNGTVNVGVDVVGTGTIDAYQSHSQSQMTFLYGVSVGAGQTVNVSGYELYGDHGKVVVESPLLFHAQVDMNFGEIQLEGLYATSYNIKGDLLTLFAGNKVMDTLKFALQPTVYEQGPVDFGVSVSHAGVSIHADASDYGGYTNLPMHV
jgi:hypothetical protein